mgnify:FL=1
MVYWYVVVYNYDDAIMTILTGTCTVYGLRVCLPVKIITTKLFKLICYNKKEGIVSFVVFTHRTDKQFLFTLTHNLFTTTLENGIK